MVQVHHALVNLSSLMVDTGTLLRLEMENEVEQMKGMPHTLRNATKFVELAARALAVEFQLLFQQAPAIVGATIFCVLWLCGCAMRLMCWCRGGGHEKGGYEQPPRMAEDGSDGEDEPIPPQPTHGGCHSRRMCPNEDVWGGDVRPPRREP
eukprot:3101130-Prymnesium_polylepis.1